MPHWRLEQQLFPTFGPIEQLLDAFHIIHPIESNSLNLELLDSFCRSIGAFDDDREGTCICICIYRFCRKSTPGLVKTVSCIPYLCTRPCQIMPPI